MKLLVLYGALLGLASLISERTRRTVLSTSVLFLVAGFVAGTSGVGLVHLVPNDQAVADSARMALFVLLFVEGSKLPVTELKQAWRLPTRSLLFGMPLTIAVLACAAHGVLLLPWGQAWLIAAILSPTDPVFAAAILEFKTVPRRLRRLLGVESGVNDGAALPIVMVLSAALSHEPPHAALLVWDVCAGVALGAAVPFAFYWLERARIFGVSNAYTSLLSVATAALLYGACQLLHANPYLAAYTAGITLASVAPGFQSATITLGAPIAEALKLAAVLAFGATLTFSDFTRMGLPGVLFVIIALLAARPIALAFLRIRGSLDTREWLSAAWFGPKGFASIVYATLVVQHRVPQADVIYSVVAMVTATSMIAHSSTDLLVARLFSEEPTAQEQPADSAEAP